MNSLSWFLYAADAANSIKVFIFIFGGACCAAGVLGWIAWSVCRGCVADMKQWPHIENTRIESGEAWIAVWDPFRKFLPLGFSLVLFACLLPSAGTLYAIAASEIGEKVVKSEAVQGIANDATKALQQWIKKQIEPDKK